MTEVIPMIGRTLLFLVVVCGGMPAQQLEDRAARTFELDVVYVGTADSQRANDYQRFLGRHFASVRIADRDSFDPASVGNADVVLLDWSQSDVDIMKMAEIQSPLGERTTWKKPTVLLGSAGLLIASPWRTNGSYG